MTAVQRMGRVVSLRPEAIMTYERRHREMPIDLQEAIRAAGIRRYTIFRHGTLLFSSSEYVGIDREHDLARLAQLPAAIAWELEMQTLQQAPIGSTATNTDWWTPLPEVFHLD